MRLFRTEPVDVDPLAESVNAEGSQASLYCHRQMKDFVREASESGWNLRDFEILALSALQTEISRAILLRRKRGTP